MNRRALKSVMLALAGPLVIGVAACAPPRSSPATMSGSAYTHPSMPGVCESAELASGNLVGCTLKYTPASTQGFGVPPLPVTTTVTAASSLPAVPAVALAAYRSAVTRERALNPSCAVTVDVIAAIGYNESRHAVLGTRLDATGKISPPILGPATSFPNTLSPADKVRFQNTGPYIQAVGATQFLPATWKYYEPDGNGDGVSDPFNIYDDAMGTAMYLCKVSHMATGADLVTSTTSYGYRTPQLQSIILGDVAAYRSILAGTPNIGTYALTNTTTVPGSSSYVSGGAWVWNGGAFNGSPALSAWESRLARNPAAIGSVRAGQIMSAKAVLPLFEGFLADLAKGGYGVDEAYSYAFRCTSNSARRDCAGLTGDDLSLHAYGLALDVNWTTNPERIYRSSGATSACAQTVATDLPAWAIAAAQRWGLFWGGYGWTNRCPGPGTVSDYVNRDAMHFEFRGTPALAAQIVAWNASHAVPAAARPAV